MSKEKPKPTFCKKHPKYRAIRQPSCDCQGCRYHYFKKTGIDLRGEFELPTLP